MSDEKFSVTLWAVVVIVSWLLGTRDEWLLVYAAGYGSIISFAYAYEQRRKRLGR